MKSTAETFRSLVATSTMPTTAWTTKPSSSTAARAMVRRPTGLFRNIRKPTPSAYSKHPTASTNVNGPVTRAPVPRAHAGTERCSRCWQVQRGSEPLGVVPFGSGEGQPDGAALLDDVQLDRGLDA